jgi:hypothetical protein
MNRRYEVTIHDPYSDRVDVVMVWGPDEGSAVSSAQDLIDYRDKRNVSGGKVLVRVVGNQPIDGDIMLREDP